MNDIIQDLEANATNGKENFCYISEKQLNAMKELYKREAKEIKQLQQENQQLHERIEYLERSNNRREDTILEQREEISNLEDNWNELKENEKDKIILDKDMFDSLFPIGTIYYSYDKEQKFPYGEWEYRGCDSMTYFFKRIK